MLSDLARNWWLVVMRGVVAIAFGILGFLLPGITLAALVLLFGAYALADGMLALAAALRGHAEYPRWSLVLKGVTGVVAGLLTFFWPGITALALVFVIAGWAIFSGAFEIVTAIRLRKEIAGEWLLVLAGVASILFGVLLAVAPGAGALAMVWIIASYAIVLGVLLIALGVRLRGQVHRLGARPTEAVS